MGHPLLLLINSTTTISSSSFKSQNFSFSPTTISPLPGKSFGFNSLNFRIQSPCHELHLTHRPRIHTATIHCSAKIQNNPEIVKERSISVILLAGGKGKKNGWFNPVFCALVVLVVASMPKQYLPLLGQPIALYSLYTFSKMTEVKEVVVVCDPSYKDIFEEAQGKINLDLKYALPGMERQDSVYTGLQEVSLESDFVCIHDSARPLVTSTDTEKVIRDGWINGAAVLGVPVKATIKEADNESFVVRTLDRKTLWEMQTPQVIKVDLLKKGFEFVNREALEVTDDVSIVEHLKHPVYITEGSYTNIKVTTPDDLLLAERILSMSSGVSPN